MQFTVTLRNNRASQIGSTIGGSGTLKFYTGNSAGITNSVTGTLLTTLTNVVYSSTAGITTITATADSSAAASGTPGYGRFNTSAPVGVIEGTAGVGAVGTTGTITFSTGAIATVPLGTGGSGYASGTYSLQCVVKSTTGNGAVVLANITGGAVASFTIVTGGFNYTDAIVVVPSPFDFTFTAIVSLGGTVTLTSGTITEAQT